MSELPVVAAALATLSLVLAVVNLAAWAWRRYHAAVIRRQLRVALRKRYQAATIDPERINPGRTIIVPVELHRRLYDRAEEAPITACTEGGNTYGPVARFCPNCGDPLRGSAVCAPCLYTHGLEFPTPRRRD